MDACYGRNLHGYSWADDDEDEFDMMAFRANAANFEYYNNSTSDETASDGDDEGEDDSSPATSPEDSDYDDSEYDEHDIPPRPSTPEPTLLAGARDYDEHDIPPRPSTPEPSFRGEDDEERDLPPRPFTPEPELPADASDWRMPPSDDAAEPPQAQPHSHKKLPGDPAFYLQTPFGYDIPPGLPPNTLYYLEYSGPWKPAYEELMWEGASSYAGAYRNIKVQRGVDGRKVMQLCGSPLRQEIKYEEANDAECEELEGDIWQDEAGVIEKWELEQGEAKGIKTFDVYKDGVEVEVAKGVQGDLLDGAGEKSDVAAAVATSSPANMAFEDELVDEAQKMGEVDSASAHDAGEPDSMHEEHEMGLFSDNESLTHSTTPESSVIVSTDDEIDVVKDSPFVLPLDEDCHQENDNVEEMQEVFSSTLPKIAPTKMKEEQEDQTNTSPRSAILGVGDDQPHYTAEKKMNPPPHALVSVTPTTHVKGLQSPATKETAAVKIIRPSNPPDSIPTSTPPRPRKDKEFSRRLETLYRIHHASKKHCRRLGSGILYALAHLPMS
ncbi:hypothetical protein P171DRAFT_5592 [Karstenula rhodostoma CBS 690.94]|uniref:Uncharacterized protein n=1 Tax=Karstenula rhodostoma CBS 690.94 TaxID=1392251 RepID=A0A9P4PWB2_9PLEO|nr:hypothetical protein P171DRAFT_5592 [Karstenula rhodostoma CBS 690.94]